MTRTITAAALCVGLLAMPLSAGFAQTMSTPVDRVLRPGDTIQWVPADPHHLQLGRAGLTPLTAPAAAYVRNAVGAHMERGTSGHCHGQRQCGYAGRRKFRIHLWRASGTDEKPAVHDREQTGGPEPAYFQDWNSFLEMDIAKVEWRRGGPSRSLTSH